MAWLGEGLTSLKGQLTNLAKGVLAQDQDEEETSSGGRSKSQESPSTPGSSGSAGTSHSASGSRDTSVSWKEALRSSDTFVGQDGSVWSGGGVESTPGLSEPVAVASGPSRSSKEEEEDQQPPSEQTDDSVASLIPRGIASFFNMSGMAAATGESSTASASSDNKSGWEDGGDDAAAMMQVPACGNTATGEYHPTVGHQLKALEEINESLKQQNVALVVEVTTLSRMVQDLESQVALSQDENANLSTGLEELDIQHQQAIEHILLVRDETQKQYDILKMEYEELRDSYEEIVKSKEKPKHISPLPSITEEECEMPLGECTGGEGADKLLRELRARDEELEAVEGENASLRATVKELNAQLEKFNENLPPILEGSEELEVMETRIQALEQENRVLAEVRTNLEAELNISRSNVEGLRVILTETEAIIRNTINQQTETEAEKRRLEELCTQLKEEKAILCAEAEAATKSAEKDKRELENLRRKLGDESEDPKKKRYRIRRDRDAPAERLAELEVLCKKLSDENTRFKKKEQDRERCNRQPLSEDVTEKLRAVGLAGTHDVEVIVRKLSEEYTKEAGRLRELQELCDRLSAENAQLEEKERARAEDERESEARLTEFQDTIDKLAVSKREVEELCRQLCDVNNDLKKREEEWEHREKRLIDAGVDELVQNLKAESICKQRELEDLCQKLLKENTDLKEMEWDWKTKEEELRAELKTAQENAQRLHEKMDGAADSERLEAENAEATRKLAQLKAELNRSDADLANAQADCQTKDRKMCEILLESMALEDEFKSYRRTEEQKYAALSKRCAELEAQLQAGERLNGESESETKLEEEVADMTDSKEKLEAEPTSQSGDHKESIESTMLLGTEQEKKELDSELENSLKLRIRALETDLEALNSMAQEYEISKDIFRQKEIEFKNQIQAKEEEIGKYKVALRDMESLAKRKETDLQERLAAMELEARRSREAERRMTSACQEYSTELGSLKENITSQTRELEGVQKELQAVTESEAMLKLRNEELGAEVERYHAEKSKADEELAACREEADTLKTSNERLSERAEALHQEVNKLQDKVCSWADKYGALFREKDTALNQMAQLNSTLATLKTQNSQLSTSLLMKEGELTSHQDKVQQLSVSLAAEREKVEKLVVEKVDFNNKYEQLGEQLKEKTQWLESMEVNNDRETGMLKQEVESLRNQLEYASQLLRVVDRQEAEGQSDANNHQKLCPNGCAQTQEEVSRLSGSLINEQTTNKLLRNQVDELADKYSKAELKLTTLKQHLVEVEENYCGELTTARDKINDLHAKFAQAEERLRSSSTAYTSASIRSNQQVESLMLQVKSVTEQKERLETELSKAEDNLQRQVAALTNLQAVLHQFQRDKQKDIDFETERIRQTLNESNDKNKELSLEIKQLTEQLNEAKRGLAAATRLSEQLDKKSETISALKKEVCELAEKLKIEQDKVIAAHSNVEGKVDRYLVKNLLVGYLTAPGRTREPAMRAIATVLELNKEERRKVGLVDTVAATAGSSAGPSPAAGQSLSEAFIRFLETESNPKPQLLLPLAHQQDPQESRSRKTSQSSTGPMSLLLTEKMPNLSHFPIGRSPGSILKDVLNDRNS